MSIADKLITVAENELKVYNSGKLATLDASKYMNASVKGTVVAVDDVYSVAHTIDVKLSSKNLIPYPYNAGSYIETNGIRFTVNSDGSITANGTATGQANFMVGFRNMQFEAGNYTLSGCPTGATWSTYTLGIVWDNENVSSIYDMGSGKTFTYTVGMVFRSLAISIFTGATVSNLTFYPQIERGTTATPYTPYINDISGIEVSRCGKNLCDISKIVEKSYYDPSINGLRMASYGRPLYTRTVLKDMADVVAGGTYVINAKHSKPNDGGTYVYLTSGRIWTYGQSITLTENDINSIIYFYKCAIDNSPVVSEEVTITEIQIELGTTATEYEPYKEPVTATANDYGTVEGLTSLTPSMTLVTDTDGIDINCQYYRDVDKYIDNLVMNVALTGGE